MAVAQHTFAPNRSQTEQVPQSLADKLAELQSSLAEVSAAISGQPTANGDPQSPRPSGCVPFTLAVPAELKAAIVQRSLAVNLDPSRLVSALLLKWLHQMTPDKANGHSIVCGLEEWERTHRKIRDWPTALPEVVSTSDAPVETFAKVADSIPARQPALSQEHAKAVRQVAKDAGVSVAEVVSQAVDEFLQTVKPSSTQDRPKGRRRARGAKGSKRCEQCAGEVLPNEGYKPQLCYVVSNKLGLNIATFNRDHARAVAMDKANETLLPSVVKTVLAYLAPAGAAVDSVTIHPRRPRLREQFDQWHDSTDIDLDVDAYSGPGRRVQAAKSTPVPCQCHQDNPTIVIPLALDLTGRREGGAR